MVFNDRNSVEESPSPRGPGLVNLQSSNVVVRMLITQG